MGEYRLDGDMLKKMLKEVITLEKSFINDKAMTDKSKIQEIKRLIEKEVNLNAD